MTAKAIVHSGKYGVAEIECASPYCQSNRLDRLLSFPANRVAGWAKIYINGKDMYICPKCNKDSDFPSFVVSS